MRTLEELRSAVSTRGSMRRSVSAAQILDLIAHVQQQAEQLATLTARVEALAGMAAPPAKLDEAPLGVGAKVLIPGEVDEVDTDGSLRVRYSAMGSDAYHAWCRAEQVRPEPAAPPPPAAPAPASDDYEARAKEMVTAWERSAGTGLPSLEERIAILLRIVDDEATAKAAEKARREERAASLHGVRRVGRDDLWVSLGVASSAWVAAGAALADSEKEEM